MPVKIPHKDWLAIGVKRHYASQFSEITHIVSTNLGLTQNDRSDFVARPQAPTTRTLSATTEHFRAQRNPACFMLQ